MLAGVALVVPSGLTLNPADPALVLAAVRARVEVHVVGLGLDTIGWLALLAAGLVLAARTTVPRPHLTTLAGGLLACSGLAGLLHNAGNLAITQLATDPAAVTVAGAVLLTAKWAVNLAGLLWVAATTTLALGRRPSRPSLRRTGVAAAVSGLGAVVLPWTTGTEGLPATLEQLGYALHLPVMAWFGLLGHRHLHQAAGAARRFEGFAALPCRYHGKVSTEGSTIPLRV